MLQKNEIPLDSTTSTLNFPTDWQPTNSEGFDYRQLGIGEYELRTQFSYLTVDQEGFDLFQDINIYVDESHAWNRWLDKHGGVRRRTDG